MKTNEELVQLIQDGQEPTKNLGLLYEQNIKIITKFVFPYSAGTDLEDLLQEAYFGLVKAVEGFDPLQGVKFMTYAQFHIVQSARRYANKNVGPRRLPEYIQNEISTCKKAAESFSKTNNRQPTSAELARVLGCTVQKIEQLQQFDKREVRSDEPIFDGEQTVLDQIADKEAEEELNTVDRVLDEQLIYGVVRELPAQMRNIVFLRFWKELTYKDIAEQLSIPKESQVKSTERTALRILSRNKIILALADSYGYFHRHITMDPYKGSLGRWKTAQGSSVELAAEDLLCAAMPRLEGHRDIFARSSNM